MSVCLHSFIFFPFFKLSSLKKPKPKQQQKKEFSQGFLANCFSIYYLAVARNCVQMLEIQFHKSGYTVLIINCTGKLTSVQFII